MDKEILNQLKINIQKIEEKKEKQEQKKLDTIYKTTEKIYYQIWKQILKQIIKKEEFEVTLRYGEFVQSIEVNNMLKKIIICNKLNYQKLYNAFKNDGLRCSYDVSSTGDLTLFIKRSDLKKIADEECESQKILK